MESRAKAGREVYIVAGRVGESGRIKDLVSIPTHTWKVALIGPAGMRLTDVGSEDDVEAVAVLMPNVAGIQRRDWTEYRTTIDRIEQLTGYDVFRRLPDAVEAAIED